MFIASPKKTRAALWPLLRGYTVPVFVTARHEVRVWLESDSQDAPLVERLSLADEALAVAERVRSER
ncbi:hypothetical protein GCM10027038_22430 [Arthrobacter bambusae]